MAPFFSTQRLELIRATPNDLAFFLSMYGDPGMMSHLGGPLPGPIVEGRFPKFEEAWNTVGFGMVILQLKTTHERVGSCLLFQTEIEGEKVLEIGWMILPQFQRKGYAFEAAQGYVNYARENLHPRVIAAFPDADNPPSNRICEKLGFKRGKPYSYNFLGRTLNSVYWRLELPPTPAVRV